MDKAELKKVRLDLQFNFRKNLKKDLKYKFLPALGQKLMIQGFRNDQGFEAGIMVLKWNGKKKDYDTWWIDYEDKDIEVPKLIEEHVNKHPLNPDMVQMAIHFHMSKIYHENPQQEELEEEETEEEYSERISGIPKGTLLS
ncbi:MAG: hypothetical protein VW270_07040 [Candidatus Poseidoniales archaeon]